MKEIAIIIPAYNAEKTISNTIESILNQSYNNYELIIVNDHSKDSTEKICKEYEKNNSDKIRFFNNIEEKKGVSSARNYGMSKSNSNYIMFIDSDDTYEKGMLLEMITNIQENDLVVCGIQKKEKDTKVEINNVYQEQTATNINQIKDLIEKLQKNELFNGPCNKIFKSKIIKDNNITFPEEISLGEDYRFVIDYVEKCRKIKNLNKVLYVYNRKKSGLALKYDNNNLRIRLENLKYHKDFYIRKKLDTYYLDNLYVLTIFSGLAEIVRNNDKKKSKEIINTYIIDENINSELKKIYKETQVLKLKLLAMLLKNKNLNLKYFVGKFFNILRNCIKRNNK